MGRDLTVAIRDFVALDRRVAQFRKEDIAPVTRRNYDQAWQLFTNFLAPVDAWKATPRDVARWMADQALRGISPVTIERRECAINYYFEQLGKGVMQGHIGVRTRISPARDLLVRQTIRGILRTHGRPRTPKAPIFLDQLDRMIDVQPETLRGIRNRALLVLGWGAALRVCELRMLDAAPHGRGDGWVEIGDDGVMVVLRRSKRNPWHRRLERYAVPARPHAPQHCPVRLLRAYLDASGIKKGPLFPDVRRAYTHTGVPCPAKRRQLSTQTIREVIKQAAKRIGIDRAVVSGHSLRSGCITYLDLEGVPPERIRELSGHEGMQGLLPYVHRPRKIGDSPLCLTHWIERHDGFGALAVLGVLAARRRGSRRAAGLPGRHSDQICP